MRTLADLRSRLAAERMRLGDGAWLLGYGLEYAALEGADYHHELLDAATGPGPMLLWALDFHTAFVNAAALRSAGIDGARTFASGSRVVVDSSGRPTGAVLEMDAIMLVMGRHARGRAG